MNFGICISTYQRKDGKTPELLRRALDSVFNQTYKNFKIFLIGDKYENNDEFEKILSEYPSEKIYYENLEIANEIDFYNNKMAILTDDENAYKWFKKARFSGRDECNYHIDDFDINPVIGWNFYMMPEISARGLLLITQFYDRQGNGLHNEDLELPYPDLSKFKIYQ
jgi:glycosyltransferase involved in cell wall biosynthesis